MDASKAGGNTSDDARSEPVNTRWWESYLVRYFVGFVVGTICVAILGASVGSDGAGVRLYGIELKPDGPGLLIGLSVVGMGYCYVASTPITVMHLGRYSRWWPDAQSRYFWLGWLVVAIVCVLKGTDPLGRSPVLETLYIAVGLATSLLLPTARDAGRELFAWDRLEAIRAPLRRHELAGMLLHTCAWALIVWGAIGRCLGSFGPRLPAPAQELWVLAAPVFWIGLVQYVVLARLIVQSEMVSLFYAHLFEARRQRGAKDVRDTYTHLREHSNSVFIVVVELSVLAFLLALGASTSLQGNAEMQRYGRIALAALFVWMLPTVFLWGRANVIERRFAASKTYFFAPPQEPLPD